jgi:hypothetical protein
LYGTTDCPKVHKRPEKRNDPRGGRGPFNFLSGRSPTLRGVRGGSPLLDQLPAMCVPRTRARGTQCVSETTHPLGARLIRTDALCGATPGAVQEGGDTSERAFRKVARDPVADQHAGSETDAVSPPVPDVDHSDRTIWWTIFAVGVVVFVGVLLLGRPLVQGRLAAARNLDRATAMIADTEAGLAAIDDRVRVVPATSQASPGGDASAEIEAARGRLKEAAVLSETGYDRLTSDEQRRAVIIKATALARLEVLDAATAVLSAGANSVPSDRRERALKEYEEAVDRVRQADAALVRL